MLFLYLLFGISFGQVLTSDFNTPFTSAKDSYRIQAKANQEDFKRANDLFKRDQCKTCCRVMFVSDYNFKKDRQFTREDDKNGDTRFR